MIDPGAPHLQNSDKDLSSIVVREQGRQSQWSDDNCPLKNIILDDSKNHISCSLPHNTSITFPWQLHSLLEAAESEGFDHIISWQGDKAFKIHNRPLFIKHVMPRFFKRQNNYKSFQRQLNLWQFQRLTRSRGPRRGGYFHPYFQRHNTSLLNCMKRSIQQKSESPRGFHGLVDLFQEDGSREMESVNNERAMNCSSSLTTNELEVQNVNSPYIFDVFFQNNNVTKSPAPHDCTMMTTPYDQVITGRSSSVFHPDQEEFNVLHEQFVNLQSSKPLLSNSGLGHVFPISREEDGATAVVALERSNKVEQVDHLACSWSPPGDDMVGSLHERSSREAMTEGSTSLPALSAAEWKYVLVGMEMAMT